MNNQKRLISPRVVIQLLVFIVVIPFLPLLISWHWDWWEAWVYAIISILGFAISRVLVARRHPDLIAERARFMQHENAKSWDKLLALLLGIGGGLVLLVAGLDALFDWSPTFSLPVKILSLVIILAGYALGSYALIENRFFSGMVRIQTDRGHPGCIERSLPLDAASWLCRGATDISGNTSLSGFILGIPANRVYLDSHGHPHRIGR